MRGVLRTAILVGCTVVASTRPAAAADWWGWLESLSGPGPWHLYDSVQGSLCPGFGTAGAPKISTVTVVDRPSTHPCFFMDYSRFQTHDPDPLVGAQVDARFYEWGVFFPIKRVFTLGSGVGVVRFSSLNKTTYKPIFSPRLVVKPLRLVKEWRASNSRWFSVLQFQLKASLIGPLTGADFGIPPEKLDAKSEFLTSYGFIIDVGEIVGWEK